MKFVLLGAIRLYQWLISPFLGECCRFSPSCSEYMKEALIKHGVFRGGWLGMKRLFMCGPWGRSGHDPVP